MARGINEIELVFCRCGPGIRHADGMGLNSNPALALQVHGIKHLGLHFARRSATRSAPAGGPPAWIFRGRYAQ